MAFGILVATFASRLMALKVQDRVIRFELQARMRHLLPADLQARTAERALLAYADVLTMTPAAVTGDHIHALRAAGYDDRAIHDACAIISYFAFVNRIADGLGVQLEAWRPPPLAHTWV